jgi:hypothetical protein
VDGVGKPGYDVEDGQTHSFPTVSKKSIPTPRSKRVEKKRSQNAARPSGPGVNQMDMSYHPDNAVNAHD